MARRDIRAVLLKAGEAAKFELPAWSLAVAETASPGWTAAPGLNMARSFRLLEGIGGPVRLPRGRLPRSTILPSNVGFLSGVPLGMVTIPWFWFAADGALRSKF